VHNGCKLIIIATLTAGLSLGAYAADQSVDTGFTLAALDQPTENIDTAQPDAIRQDQDLFGENTWSLQTYGSAALSLTQGELYAGHVGVGWYFVEDLSINIEAVGGAFNGRKGSDDGDLYELDLIFRHHFYKTQCFSIFAEVGGGLFWGSDHFPAGGTHANFTPQAGVGFTYNLSRTFKLSRPALLMVGGRWFHLSNAARRGGENNPGVDTGMVYAGVMFPF